MIEVKITRAVLCRGVCLREGRSYKVHPDDAKTIVRVGKGTYVDPPPAGTKVDHSAPQEVSEAAAKVAPKEVASADVSEVAPPAKGGGKNSK